MDGKHVRIVPPAKSGSYYYNYKGYLSIILFAVANANLEFIYVDFGKMGEILTVECYNTPNFTINWTLKN